MQTLEAPVEGVRLSMATFLLGIAAAFALFAFLFCGKRSARWLAFAAGLSGIPGIVLAILRS
ncbi:MAG TPA: hypothetical protein DHW63_12150 [Hyphomonadaceae bacterium]|nr:hypothetical protein [Hyphomonadaceae bacterium]